jgi:hypothetical protein
MKSYEDDILNGYMFWDDDKWNYKAKMVTEAEGYPCVEHAIMWDNRFRKSGWVALPGAFTLDEPQRKIVKAKPGQETAKHLMHLMAFHAGKHQKATGTPYNMYAHLNVWVNSGDEDDPHEIGIDATFTNDPEGKNPAGASMATYLAGDWGGLTMKEWLKLDGKTYPVGCPIWTDWGNRIEILIHPKRGK